MWKRWLGTLVVVLVLALAMFASVVYGMIYYVRHAG
jgi:hypothetical protein